MQVFSRNAIRCCRSEIALVVFFFGLLAITGTVQARSTQQDEAQSARDRSEAFRIKVEPFIKEWTVHRGAFRMLRVGQTRAEVLDALLRMDIKLVGNQIIDPAEASSPDEIEALNDAQVIVLQLYVEIEFDGDTVSSISEPGFKIPELDSRLSGLKTREDVFEFIADFLAGYSDFSLSAFEVKPGPIFLELQEPGALEWLRKIDSWSFAMNDAEGWWSGFIIFEEDELIGIRLMYSPFELP